MVYVDELRIYPNAWGPFLQGSCHMFARLVDTNALHALAARIGLKRAWYQHAGKGTAHYDLTPAKRVLALHAGAIDRVATVAIWRENRVILATQCTSKAIG